MHIAPHDNHNQPVIGPEHPLVPLVYFNILRLIKGESFTSQVAGYETCIVPATGTVDVVCGAETFAQIGQRRINVWDGEPEGVYVPAGMAATITCQSDSAEIFVAGARCDTVFAPFAIRAADIDPIQYGSDDTKTHRKIKHILGQKYHDRVGRLLVSELYTVGTGGWSGFPSHKHDTERLPLETRHDEVYNFRFNPPRGSGLQMMQREEGKPGEAYHVMDGSTLAIDRGYHPVCVLPGYQMYYFTILGGLTQRPLVQYFQPDHADQIETIPGIKNMIAKFK
ncbi:MAG: 5-deoxy-glucuronate isomerase [Paracoccaceae bacterium]